MKKALLGIVISMMILPAWAQSELDNRMQMAGTAQPAAAPTNEPAKTAIQFAPDSTVALTAERIKSTRIFKNPQQVKYFYAQMQSVNKAIERAQAKALEDVPEQNTAQREQIKRNMDRQTPVRFKDVNIDDAALNKLINEKPETAMLMLSSRLEYQNAEELTLEEKQEMLERLKSQFKGLTGFTVEEYQEIFEKQLEADNAEELEGEELLQPDTILGGEVVPAKSASQNE